MDLAVNNFGKGLQTDTHPMIQGTDTLSDCLNGTLITMNGNEVILQNDMGNRRVNNAFLPSGYLPVGMKEYGGVIYVAAYNPITNKSQIGSFPSPLRLINSDINKDLLGNRFDFDEVLRVGTDQVPGTNTYKYLLKNIDKEVVFLNNDVFLIPLTSDIVLHAGDKFIVSTIGLKNTLGSEYITNYENVSEDSSNTTKAISPKNKRYTLSLGVLNSQNEFVDITKTLCRWKENVLTLEWEIVDYTPEYSEIYKFNDGYFIPELYDNSSLDETINDVNFIRIRQAIPANTYAYKLIGPLYLKVTFNHIETFSFNIYGVNNNDEILKNDLPPALEETEGDNLESNDQGSEGAPGDDEGEDDEGEDDEEESQQRNVNLWIEAFMTYNCPDGVIRVKSSGNLDYETFSEGVPTFRAFDLIDGLLDSSDKIRTPDDTTTKSCVYSPNNNIYSVKMTKKYNNITSETNTYNYFIGVLADKDLAESNDDSIYIKGLSAEGTIDLDLLGSGIVTSDTWKFHNEITESNKISSLVLIGLTSYLDSNYTYGNLRFKFVDIDSNIAYYGPLKNPSDTITFASLDEGDPIPIFNSDIDLDIGTVSVIQFRFNELQFKSENNNTLPSRKVFQVFTYCDMLQVNLEDDEEAETPTILYKEFKFKDYHGSEDTRWFVSTELFNGYFGLDSITNFCSIEVTPGEPGYNEGFAELMNVMLDSLSEIIETYTRKESLFDGEFITKNNNKKIHYKSKNPIEFELDYNSNIKIKGNELLYPDFIEINDNPPTLSLEQIRVRLANREKNVYEDYNTNSISNNTINFSNEYNEFIGFETNGTQTNIDDNDFNESFLINNINIANNKVKGTIEHCDILSAIGEEVQHISVFKRFSDYIKNRFSDLIKYFGIVINYQRSPNNHFVDVIYCGSVDNPGNNYPQDGNFYPGIPFLNEPIPRVGVSNRPAMFHYDRSYDMSGVLSNIKEWMNWHGDYLPNHGGYDGRTALFAYVFSWDRTSVDTNGLVKLHEHNLRMKHTISDTLEPLPGGIIKDYEKELEDVPDYYTNPDKYSYNHRLGEKYARVWWRTDNDQNRWALFDNLLEKTSSDLSLSVSRDDFISFIENNENIKRDYIYCIEEDYLLSSNDDKIYALTNNSSYKCTNPYKISLYLGLIFELSDTTNVFKRDFENFVVGNLKFTSDLTIKNIKETKYIGLENNSKFQNNIFNFKGLNIIPIYDYNGIVYTRDSSGLFLNINNPYYLLNGLLEYDNKHVVRLKLEGGIPVLLYHSPDNAINPDSSPTYRYDHLGNSSYDFDNWESYINIPETYLDYEGVNLVNFNE